MKNFDETEMFTNAEDTEKYIEYPETEGEEK